jgi:hypothetical protein
MDLNSFDGLSLPGGFHLQAIRFADANMIDPLGRPALAKSVIEGSNISISVLSLSDMEISISIYHEILEALTVAHNSPPESILMLNEAGFEQAAQDAHQKYGFATPSSVIEFLRNYGFNE